MNNNVPIFRYNFSENFNQKLEYFSNIHKNDDRFDFKEYWDEWVENNEEIINYEKRRLKCLGYEGDVINKMFISARYYFRKKNNTNILNNYANCINKVNDNKQNKCERVTINKELLKLMDEHIKKNKLNKNYTPQFGYEEFIKENNLIVELEILNLLIFINGRNNIEKKIKKTYKNRFYLICRK